MNGGGLNYRSKHRSSSWHDLKLNIFHSMNIIQYFKDAWTTIKSNLLRSFLSILGIVIGIVSVVVMMAIWKWAEKELMDNLWDLAKNQLNIYQWWSENWKQVTITKDTINYLENTFKELSWNIVYQVFWWSSEIKDWKEKQTEWNNNMTLYGVPLNWYQHSENELLYWAFFSQQQYDNAEKVAIISFDLYERLFSWKNPIGQKITFNKKIYAIIGVFKKQQREENFSWKNYSLWIPYTTIKQISPNRSNISDLVVYLPNDADNGLRRKRVLYALMKYYNKNNVSDAWIQVDSFSKYVDEMKKQSQTMNYLLLAIWTISLLVGWIGVMNIMLVSVTERTKEIWIRKALWALKSDIVIQFLVESILISLIWWIIAIILSYWIARLINKYWSWMWFHALITWNVVITALIITSITWIIFWILPARRAAKLNVIDALRYE